MNPVAKMLLDMARYYHHEIDNRQLEIYVEVLSQFPADEVLKSGKEYILNPRNTRFPQPAHAIMAKYFQEADPRTLAVATVGRIRLAIEKFGWPKPGAAKEFIGEAGWRQVERAGGWQAICEKPELNVYESNVAAQMRDAIEADIKLGNLGFNTDRPLIEQQKSPKGLKSAGDIVKNLLPTQTKGES